MSIRDENGFELIDYDQATGRSVWAYFDGEKTVYRTDYPVDGLINVNAKQRNMAMSGWKGDMHHVASIPLNVAHDSGLTDAFGQDDEKFISKWLNDGDNRAWRTKEGNL